MEKDRYNIEGMGLCGECFFFLLFSEKDVCVILMVEEICVVVYVFKFIKEMIIVKCVIGGVL